MVVVCCIASTFPVLARANAQQKPKHGAAQAERDSIRQAKAERSLADSAKVGKFFRDPDPLAVTLTINVKRIKGDRDTNPPWRAATLKYKGDDGVDVTVPVRARTRGIWRLKFCDFPPLRLSFSNDATKHTLFHGLDRPKLVNFCHNDDAGEQYILQEFQLYRIYRLLTPASHRVRLLRMTYADSASGKVEATRYAFLEEDPDALAARLDGRMLKLKGARPDDLEPVHDALVGVFEYLIGNTDFALGALHNAELVGLSSGEYWPVVYDFDFSGAVNARYATTDPRLPIHNVRDRLYRGYCVPEGTYPKVFAVFDAKKDSIYALYRDTVGKLLRAKTVNETLRYFDDFYSTIDTPRKSKDAIIDACLGKR
jgi:hypothetical protein